MVIEKAAKHTLIFCSTADRGTGLGPAYPADYDGTVRISATDKYGNLMPASDKTGSHAINIPVPGEDIPALGPSYMSEGIASLTLMMLLVFNDTDKDVLRVNGLYTNNKAAISPGA
ncbi:hypothetical protein B0T26DRAFT_725163 [Lasiosphaeria miniovina]|uniref:Uncharacterized protein n=1 Tax=Lasiosphaeria miniovina TaxID=1954250 RepID=A0AA40DN64_9PEZI|nr:uncharacterized protein B0T26DRAFT_725163 [Lasiosphaeria miniovina]KAK0705993.1 hypothetical protein B0T26DRAFT_725163 [Lasiosphaeria miniovina]